MPLSWQKPAFNRGAMISFFMLASSFFLLPRAVMAQASDVVIKDESAPIISLNVPVSIVSKPDYAQITLGASALRDKAAQAISEVNAITSSIYTKVMALGVEERDIITENFNLYPREKRQNKMIVGHSYHVSHQYRIKIRDIKRVGEIIDAATLAGANSIQNIRFTSDPGEAQYAKARARAFAKARRIAMGYARTAGYNAVKVININEGGNSSRVGSDFYAARQASPLNSAKIATGEVTRQFMLHVKFHMVKE